MTLRTGGEEIDGLAYFEAVILPGIEAARAAGARPVMVFDIDNTLVDTRHRTLAAVREFGRTHGLLRLAEARLEDVGVDGRESAARLGLGRTGLFADALHAAWNDHFWRAESFALDREIPAITALAHRAKAAGAEIVYLTGRVEALRAGTRDELQRLGLPDADDAHLFLKPRVGVPTDEFKLGLLRSGFGFPGAALCGFVTDGQRDLRLAIDRLGVPPIWIRFPVDPDPALIRPGTPTIGAAALGL